MNLRTYTLVEISGDNWEQDYLIDCIQNHTMKISDLCYTNKSDTISKHYQEMTTLAMLDSFLIKEVVAISWDLQNWFPIEHSYVEGFASHRYPCFMVIIDASDEEI